MRRALVLTTATVATALLVLGLACSSTDIIATTVPGDAGHTNATCGLGDSGDGGDRCLSGQFCSKATCTLNGGTCEDVESDACAGPDIVCGCDGITYYNSCARRAAQISPAGPSICNGFQMGVTPRRCHDSTGCGPNASCAVLVPGFLLDAGSLPDAGQYAPPDLCQGLEQGLLFSATCWSFQGGRLVKPVCNQFECIDDVSTIRSKPFFAPCLDASPP
jgi:hypothetical protein